MMLSRLVSLRAMILVAAFAVTGSCGAPPQAELTPATAQSPIARAVFADGKVWIVREDGRLFSFSDGDGSLTRHSPAERMVDICSGDSGLWAVASGAAYSLYRWQDGRWLSAGEIDKRGDFLHALGCGPGGPVLVMNRRLVTFIGASGQATPLSASILPEDTSPTGTGAVVHLSERWAFVGLDIGEWGGGLRRIDRHSGRVDTIEQIDGDLCDGALNTHCDRVQAIAAIPWARDCLAIAIDVGHGGEGRMTKVCGGRAEQVLAVRDGFNAIRPELADRWRHGGTGSTPFLGVVASGENLILAGGNGIYAMGPGGVSYLGWPGVKAVGDLSVSFAIPGAILVAQNWNSEYSFYETVRLISKPL